MNAIYDHQIQNKFSVYTNKVIPRIRMFFESIQLVALMQVSRFNLSSLKHSLKVDGIKHSNENAIFDHQIQKISYVRDQKLILYDYTPKLGHFGVFLASSPMFTEQPSFYFACSV